MKKLLFCVFVIVAMTTIAQVRPTIQWVNYLSKDPGISAISSGLDGNSNVYTAGRIYNTFPGNADIVVQCTDSTGATLWTYTYDNGGYDCPHKVRIDGAGNTILTGVSFDATTGLDYITILIDNAGNATWVSRFDGGLNDIDEAYDVRMDGNSDVYITGKSKNGSGNFDAVTLKLDGSSGSLIWKDIFDPYGQNDDGVGLVLANGQTDVIVAGNSIGANGDDIVAYQLNASSGLIGWVQTVDGTSNSNDKCSGIILSGANVVLCGMVNNSGTAEDYTTIKLDAGNGSVVFKSDYDYSHSDIATSVVKDSTGNIAVTGLIYNSGSGFYEYHTRCYDSTGTVQWTHIKLINCTSTNVYPSIVCDTIAHHFYIAGEKENTDRDILVYQLTPGGNLGWEKAYTSVFGGTDAATSLVVNGIGVIFASGSTYNGIGSYDIATLKIVQTPVYFPPDYGTQELKDPQFVFQKNHGQLLTTGLTAVSESEVGYYNQNTNPSYYFNNSKISHILFDKDAIQDTIVRVDLSIIGANQHAEIFHYKPVDETKNYFITSVQGITDVRSYERLFIPEVSPNVDLHHYSNTAGLKSYFVFKTPGEGMVDLRLKVEGATSTAIDVDGNLIATTILGDINMGMLTAYQATFNPTTQNFVLMPLTVSWNNQGSGIYNFNISGYVPFWPVVVYVSKLGATSLPTVGPIGNLWWCTFIGGQGEEELLKNRIDAKDNYYICGRTTAANYPVVGPFFAIANNPSSSQFGILNKFKNDGSLLYGTYFGGVTPLGSCGNAAYTQISDVAIDSLYNIYMVGYTTSSNLQVKTIAVAGALNYQTNASSGGSCSDAFIAKLNPNGNALHYSSYFGGNGQDRFTRVRYKNGQVHVGGWCGSTTIPLVTAQPNTYQISSGAGMYLHMDTAGALIHNTRIQNNVDGLDVDDNGNCYLISTGYSGSSVPLITPAGSFYSLSNQGARDWVLQRFTAADSLNWSTYIGGSSDDNATDICIKDSLLAICGNSESTNWPFVKGVNDSGDVVHSTSRDIASIKFNRKTGQILWSAFHATIGDETAYGVNIDKDYNMILTGNVSGASSVFRTYSPGAGYYVDSSPLSGETFILAYSSINKRKWTTYFGSTVAGTGSTPYNDEYSYSSVINNSSKLFLLGSLNTKNNSLPLAKWNSACHYDTLVADIGTAAKDGFSAMFDITELIIVGQNEQELISRSKDWVLFPNPNSGIFTVRFTGETHQNLDISVMNILGQRVYENHISKLNRDEVQIDLAQLKKGIYLVTVEQESGIQTIKIIIQ